MHNHPWGVETFTSVERRVYAFGQLGYLVTGYLVTIGTYVLGTYNSMLTINKAVVTLIWNLADHGTSYRHQAVRPGPKTRLVVE